MTDHSGSVPELPIELQIGTKNDHVRRLSAHPKPDWKVGDDPWAWPHGFVAAVNQSEYCGVMVDNDGHRCLRRRGDAIHWEPQSSTTNPAIEHQTLTVLERDTHLFKPGVMVQIGDDPKPWRITAVQWTTLVVRSRWRDRVSWRLSRLRWWLWSQFYRWLPES